MQCSATSKQTGNPCKLSAVPGAVVCRFHGGGAPQVRARAAARLAQAEALERIHEQEVPDLDNPLAAFARLAAESVALKDFLAGKVGELGEFGTTNDHGTEQVRVVVALYERAMDRAGRFLTDWARLNLDERLVAITERQAELIGQVIDAVLADVGMTAEQQERAREALPRHLALVSGG